MHSELIVKIKSDSSTYTKRFSLYDPYLVSDTDPIILGCIHETKTIFELQNEIIDDLSITIKINSL